MAQTASTLGEASEHGRGVDRLKMSVIQAAMLLLQQQLFSNKNN